MIWSYPVSNACVNSSAAIATAALEGLQDVAADGKAAAEHMVALMVLGKQIERDMSDCCYVWPEVALAQVGALFDFTFNTLGLTCLLQTDTPWLFQTETLCITQPAPIQSNVRL
jgi:hypothetical protein